MFQSTRPRGARRIAVFNLSSKACFNPRARVGRDCRFYRIFQRILRFNPRARVGRDLYTIIVVLTRLDVSIHAPAWGATTMASTAMGGTPGFNPRARVGRDSTFDHCYSVTNVSIHAPAWGATHRLVYQGRCYLPFQSTRPRGARHTIYNI